MEVLGQQAYTTTGSGSNDPVVGLAVLVLLVGALLAVRAVKVLRRGGKLSDVIGVLTLNGTTVSGRPINVRVSSQGIERAAPAATAEVTHAPLGALPPPPPVAEAPTLSPTRTILPER